MSSLHLDSGSFRDPSAYVFTKGSQIIRAVMPVADTEFRQTIDSGVVAHLAKLSLMLPCTPLNLPASDLASFVGPRGEVAAALYEQPRIPLISYPYEWSFSQLKDAALAHLDLQIAALEKDYVLSDASAYNMQFINAKPLHIDVMSLRPYREGQHWDGYNQFCRQFLLPLAIEAWTGLSFQPMYRGAINGISFADALAILPRRKLFTSLGGLMHIYLQGQSVMSKSATTSVKTGAGSAVKPLPRARYRGLIEHLRGFIDGLQSRKRPASFWKEYAVRNSYTDDMRGTKLAFVADWAKSNKPGQIIDIGGNTGDFSMAAIESGGSSSSIVLDGDLDAIEQGYRMGKVAQRPILHLLMNLADPTPDLGWRQCERKGLRERADTGGVLALAVIHHMVVAGNLPLSQVLDWLIDMAPTGIIEFVPKQDPMVVEMLLNREDIFSDYVEDNFRALVEKRATILAEHKFPQNGRLLVAFVRKG
jgi:ribosomal protein L11 methylase PrmA